MRFAQAWFNSTVFVTVIDSLPKELITVKQGIFATWKFHKFGPLANFGIEEFLLGEAVKGERSTSPSHTGGAHNTTHEIRENVLHANISWYTVWSPVDIYRPHSREVICLVASVRLYVLVCLCTLSLFVHRSNRSTVRGLTGTDGQTDATKHIRSPALRSIIKFPQKNLLLLFVRWWVMISNRCLSNFQVKRDDKFVTLLVYCRWYLDAIKLKSWSRYTAISFDGLFLPIWLLNSCLEEVSYSLLRILTYTHFMWLHFDNLQLISSPLTSLFYMYGKSTERRRMK